MNIVRFSLCSLLLSFSVVAGADDLVNAEVAYRGFSAPVQDHGAFIIREVDGDAVCTDATPEEALRINARPNVELRVFGEERDRVRANASAGLNIILRGTAQLDANPAAKAAFARAADIWESRIADPITVYVDVDFGSTRFGAPFEENVIASADSDYRGGNDNFYAPIRGLIAAHAHNAGETALYGTLPGGSTLPTDLGATSKVVYPSIQMRALGGIAAVALPGDSAPSIGFNSAFPYDFDPSNGISPTQTDFEGVVVHEIGHMLGFVSRVGGVELGVPNAPTIFDFFRLRPGVNSGNFGSANRVQSSGGDQVYFNGSTTLGLSTGRPDGTGGDEQQASHWKDDAQAGFRIGVMDPTLSKGARSELTDADLQAFGMMGFNVVSASSGCSESEPNETPANADDLGLPGSCSGSVLDTDASNIQINYNDGTTDKIEDLFKVTLGTSAKIKVTLSFNSGDLDVFLMGISGSSITMHGLANSSASPEVMTSTNTLSPGTYYVGVSAFDNTSPSAYTVSTELVGAVSGPAAPSNLQATGTSTSVIRLTWTDNSNNETEFRIEQRVNGSFVDIGKANPNTTAANIVGFPPNTSATFRIRARGASGDSGYSNEATGTTLPATTGPCTANATTVCLVSGRFQVKIDYFNPGAQQNGTFKATKQDPAAVSPDVALFGFDDARAIEVVVRIIDVRPYNIPGFDIYWGGLTDFPFTVYITDTQTGRSQTYQFAGGEPKGKVDRATFKY